MKTLSLWTLLVAAVVPASAQLLINGAGATFPYPIYAKWFDEYHKINPKAQINYQSIGSGGGIRQLQAGTVDFGASDSPMTDEQMSQVATARCCTSRPCWARWCRPTTCPASSRS